jgi:transcriptional regulator with XRE-family HTH domain
MLSIDQNFCDLHGTKPFLKFANTAIPLFYTILMSFGKRLLEARKNKGINQEALAEQLGTKGPAIGRYERDEMKPSIDAAAKMADILGVSLDWLVGHTDLELDKGMINRIQEVTKMKDKEKEHVFAMLDAFITSTKMQGFLAK